MNIWRYIKLTSFYEMIFFNVNYDSDVFKIKLGKMVVYQQNRIKKIRHFCFELSIHHFSDCKRYIIQFVYG